jgi:hypothetical protein
MAEISYEREILDALHKLNADQQRRVLEFAQGLTYPQGISGKQAVQYAREINFPPEDLLEMEKAIEEAFEQVEDEEINEVNLDE